MIKVSVVVPVYNVEKYLARCLDSLVNQTLKEIEIIIINDGSTDRSGVICEQYKKRFKNIIYVYQNNQGLSGARNTGINLAKGEFIGFVDSDDFVSDDMFEMLYENAVGHRSNISACGYSAAYPNGKTKILSYDVKAKFYNRDEAMQYYLLPRYFELISCNKIFKRELFKRIKFPIGKVYEDVPTIYRLIYAADGLYYDSAPNYFYFRRGGSLSSSGSCSNTKFLLKCIDDFVEFCEKNTKKLDLVYLGQLWWYVVAFNKFLSVDRKDISLLKRIKMLFKKQLHVIVFSHKIGVKEKLKMWLLVLAPDLYCKIYFFKKRLR